jgi:hypothetical protein
MNYVSGTFNGTGATLYLCIGFIPDWVRMWTSETTDEERIEWSINMRGAELGDGIGIDDDGTITPHAYGTAIQVYRGGDRITAASTVYLVRDPDPDKRNNGTGADITTWTLDTPGSRSGHWNDVCNTTYVGEGSVIIIDGKKYRVISVTSNGEAADEVVLDGAAPSGQIDALSGMYDYIGAAANVTTPEGFKVNDTTLNASGELCFFEAGNYM